MTDLCTKRYTYTSEFLAWQLWKWHMTMPQSGRAKQWKTMGLGGGRNWGRSMILFSSYKILLAFRSRIHLQRFKETMQLAVFPDLVPPSPPSRWLFPETCITHKDMDSHLRMRLSLSDRRLTTDRPWDYWIQHWNVFIMNHKSCQSETNIVMDQNITENWYYCHFCVKILQLTNTTENYKQIFLKLAHLTH